MTDYSLVESSPIAMVRHPANPSSMNLPNPPHAVGSLSQLYTASFDRVLSDEFSLFSVPYYSYLSPYTKFALLETRYKSMSEYFRRSYVHEWRFAFTGKSGNSPLERAFKYFYAGKNFTRSTPTGKVLNIAGSQPGSTSALVTEVSRRYNGRLARTRHKWRQKAFRFALLPMASFRQVDLSKIAADVPDPTGKRSEKIGCFANLSYHRTSADHQHGGGGGGGDALEHTGGRGVARTNIMVHGKSDKVPQFPRSNH
ncbi:hypothetical protein EAG_11340 [Camponotus floridanus]|uniref:Uncharacterized protein n=1 Tax=Camponotus floridanus TaxID=104421 RepID=E2A0Z4_CAMFO|nr:hypothetical protein EAG_11340 [Camponotus floridanus]